MSKEFATIFEQLVPAGHGRLVIQRKADRGNKNRTVESDEEPTGVENYTGVGISVSFNSKVADEQQKIQQLSGGQKSKQAPVVITWPETAALFTNVSLFNRSVRPVPDLCPPGSRVQPLCHL